MAEVLQHIAAGQHTARPRFPPLTHEFRIPLHLIARSVSISFIGAATHRTPRTHTHAPSTATHPPLVTHAHARPGTSPPSYGSARSGVRIFFLTY
jgi:hypothetical protein